MSHRPQIAVFADFDDTLATTNVARNVIRRFAPDALDHFSAEYRNGQITFREYQERSFDAVDVSIEEMSSAAAESTTLRDGLDEMLRAIDEVDGEFTVASAGLNFYIDAVLRHNGFDSLLVVCGTARERTDGQPGFRYDYPFASDSGEPCRGDWATCKCKALMQAGGSAVTVFVGDGRTSDACVAERADHVFARDRLLRICNENDIEATPFEDFLPVAEFIRRLAVDLKHQQEEQTEPR